MRATWPSPPIRRGITIILVLTRPDVIGDITRAYLGCGDPTSPVPWCRPTPSFGATASARRIMPPRGWVADINIASGRLARAAGWMELCGEGRQAPLLFAGAIGPTNKTLVPQSRCSKTRATAKSTSMN